MKLPPRTCHLADAVFVHDGVRVDAALRGREAPREQVTDALPPTTLGEMSPPNIVIALSSGTP
jgi:hypothetical protein